MPVSRVNNIYRTRDLLMRPQPQSPSFHDYLSMELSCERDICNSINNTGVAWGLAETQINYSPLTDTYPLNVDDFGKVMYVVKATTNPYIPYIEVPFSDVSNQLYGTVWSWFGNSNYAQPFAMQETPERMSFYRAGVINSQPSVKIQPMPQISATYTIAYLPGFLSENDPLESSIQMPEHAELVRLRAAMGLLPQCRWFEDENQNLMRKKELMASFDYQLNRPITGKEAIFREYMKSMNRGRQVDIESWNAFA